MRPPPPPGSPSVTISPFRLHGAIPLQTLGGTAKLDRVPPILGGASKAPLPGPLARAADHLAGYGHDWALCGGWAVDVLLGRQTRDHLDVDIAVFQEDQAELRTLLNGWRLLGHDDAVAEDCPDQWDGRWLDVPGHVHANITTMAGTELDIQICRRVDDEWVLSGEPRVALPMSATLGTARWGSLPVVSALVILYYKAVPPRWRAKPDDPQPPRRPKDEADFAALLPTLSSEQRTWLHSAITASHPDHDWSRLLAGE